MNERLNCSQTRLKAAELLVLLPLSRHYTIMSDILAKGRPLRKIADLLNLPLPKPETLIRGYHAWTDKPLEGYKVLSNAPAEMDKLFSEAGATKAATGEKADALVYFATGVEKAEQIDDAYRFYSSNLKYLARNGRVLVVVQHKPASAVALASQRALDGFMRSIAKEIGRRGATANMILWSGDTLNVDRLKWPVLFLLSRHSAYIDAQVIRVDETVSLPSPVALSKSLQGKVALVTGAARGIGEAIALRLAEEGAKVLIVDHPSQDEAAKATAQKTNGSVLLQDLSTADAPQKVADWIKAETGGVDIVIHNAGLTRDKTLAKMTEDQWQLVLQVNYRTILALNDALLPELMNEGGRMVCMSSISGLSGNFGQANYAATKAALIGYVAAVAPELAAKGITANAIAPGFIETQMTAKMPFFTAEGGRRLNNLSQAGLPEDIAEATVFLSTPGSAGVTGQTLRVCGGSMIGA